MYRRILLSIARLRALGLLCVAILSSLSINAYAANSIDGIRLWPAPENTRIVFDVKQKPDYKFFTLSKPNRLVIDFTNTLSAPFFPFIGSNQKLSGCESYLNLSWLIIK